MTTTTLEHEVDIKCYETMGVPNTEARCTCGAVKTYFIFEAQREGFRSDLDAAYKWRMRHKENPDG